MAFREVKGKVKHRRPTAAPTQTPSRLQIGNKVAERSKALVTLEWAVEIGEENGIEMIDVNGILN